VLEQKRSQHLGHRDTLLNCFVFDGSMERLGEIQREAFHRGRFGGRGVGLVAQVTSISTPATTVGDFPHWRLAPFF